MNVMFKSQKTSGLAFIPLQHIIDLSLLHVMECGRLTNRITHSLPF